MAVYLWTAPGRDETHLSRSPFPELLERSKKDTENPRVFYHLGVRLQQLGQINDSRKALERAATLDAENEDIWLAWAAVSARTGQDEEPFGILSSYLETHPKSVRAHLALSLLYQQVEAYQSAYDSAHTAATLDPENTGLLRVMASTALELGKKAESREAAEKALTLEPGDWRHYHLLARVLDEEHQYPEASSAYEKAITLAPNETRLLTALAQVKQKTASTENDFRIIVEILEKSLKLDPRQGYAYLELGKAYTHLKQYPEAEQALAQAAAMLPRDDTVFFARRQLAESVGDREAVARYSAEHQKLLTARLERLRLHSELGQRPRDAELRLKYARFLAAEGDFRGALDHYRRLLNQVVIAPAIARQATAETRKILQAHPDALNQTPLQLPLPAATTTNEAPIADLLRDAATLLEKEQFAAAETAYQKVLARNSNLAEAYEGLGLAYEGMSKTDQAFQALNKATEIDPNRVKAQYALSGIYYESGFAEEGVRRMEKVVENAPNEPKYWYALGYACLNLESVKRKQQGLRALQRATQLAPGNLVYLRDMAIMERANQKYVDAETHLREALTREPNDFVTLSSLADLLAEQQPTPERLREAESLLRKAEGLSPKNPIILASLGATLLAQGKAKDAVGPLEEAVMQNPNKESTWYKLHRAYTLLKNKERSDFSLKMFRQIDDFKQSLSIAEERARMDMKNPSRRLDLARLYAQSEQHARAINQYQMCLKLDPNQAVAKKELESLMSRLKASGQLPAMQTFEGMIIASTMETNRRRGLAPVVATSPLPPQNAPSATNR